MDERIFAAAYPGGGQDSYHPKILTKIIIYAYTQCQPSGKKIASKKDGICLSLEG
ncbi:hypothetical protein ACEU3E_13300 [Paenibacillus oleatilyticus]|uniref:Transposase n=1 Tax=Paenibacillus oleatilyticus TaxID=2594886 RepID=A0ABV4UZA6_9BACL